MNHLSAFHNFIERGKTTEALICLKQFIDVAHKTDSKNAKYPESSALHIAAIND